VPKALKQARKALNVAAVSADVSAKYDRQYSTLRNHTQKPYNHTQLKGMVSMNGLPKNIRFFSDFVEKVPGLGDSISDAVIVSWNKEIGEQVNEDDVVCVLETDKVSVDIRATSSGKLMARSAEVDDTVTVGQDLWTIDTAASGSAASAAPAAAAAPAAEAAPAAAPAAPAAKAAAAPAAAAAAPAAHSGPSRNETNVPMSRMRMTIARRLKDSQNTAAMLTTFNEIDMKNLMDMRKSYQEQFVERHGVKLGFMSAFIKASTVALTKYPVCNAVFDLENKCTTYREYVDVSVAVSTPTGLVVPVLRNTESMSFAGIETALGDMGKKARAGKITMEDMVGGTFTISNGGVFGSLMGTPILNPPQSAILGMHGIFQRPVAINGKVEIRPMMYVALTYDHRILDGGDAVKLLKEIKMNVEDPTRLLLDL